MYIYIYYILDLYIYRYVYLYIYIHVWRSVSYEAGKSISCAGYARVAMDLFCGTLIVIGCHRMSSVLRGNPRNWVAHELGVFFLLVFPQVSPHCRGLLVHLGSWIIPAMVSRKKSSPDQGAIVRTSQINPSNLVTRLWNPYRWPLTDIYIYIQENIKAL